MTQDELIEWATRIVHRADPQPHQLLEIKAESGLDDAQAAFHKVARQAHPDLHRNSLSAEQLELVTSAYAKVAGAYQDFRQLALAPRPKVIEVKGAYGTRNVPPPPPVEEPEAAPQAGGPVGQMNSKAMLHYRKAEMSLRRGELKTAVLQLKMASAADPQSKFVRIALAEVMAELAKSGG
ncbi:MAG: hypothetical protein KF773_04375 [Deltaproteobacteria bacterium]|nr:hypothetical protein [Deltaproteobacteria bacterium]MCW5807038.1 hypothetical protein [Deltaproteobacteria bacterium]